MIETIIAKGYRMSANADEALAARCAAEVRKAYLNVWYTDDEVAAAAEDSDLMQAWCGLTYLRYLQCTSFGTRTGGERKDFDHGMHMNEMKEAKTSCGLWLRVVGKGRPELQPVVDICDLYFRTQLYL